MSYDIIIPYKLYVLPTIPQSFSRLIITTYTRCLRREKKKLLFLITYEYVF